MRKFIVIAASFVIFAILLTLALSVNPAPRVSADAAETVLWDHTRCAETKEALQTDIAAILSATPTDTPTPTATATRYTDVGLSIHEIAPVPAVQGAPVYVSLALFNAGTGDEWYDGLSVTIEDQTDAAPKTVVWRAGVPAGGEVRFGTFYTASDMGSSSGGPTPRPYIQAQLSTSGYTDTNSANNLSVADYRVVTATPTATAVPYVACEITATANYTTASADIEYTIYYTNVGGAQGRVYIDGNLERTDTITFTGGAVTTGYEQGLSAYAEAERHTVLYRVRANDYEPPLVAECEDSWGVERRTWAAEYVTAISIAILASLAVVTAIARGISGVR